MNGFNKRRQTPLKYKILVSNLNLIYTTLLTVKYSKEDYTTLKESCDKSPYITIRKRCRAIMAKMSEPKLGCERIAAMIGASRNSVREWIHDYNNGGVHSVLSNEVKTGRPGKLTPYLAEIDSKIEERAPKTSSEVVAIIKEISGVEISLSRARQVLHMLKYRYIKLQPIPGKADVEKQKEWVDNLQPVVNEARNGRRRLLFQDAVHFTLEAFLCNVWCKEPLFLKSGAGRNRFNLLGCIDPFSLDLIESHSMVYVDAQQVKAFLEKVRANSGDIPISIILDNARYQHCKAVLEKAKELNIDLIFLPPYSPNLNIIERLWKYTRRHVLAGKFFDSPAKFHEALRFFFEDDFVNHKDGLKSLLTLNFQSFENAHLLCA